MYIICIKNIAGVVGCSGHQQMVLGEKICILVIGESE